MCYNGFRLWVGCELLPKVKEFISGFVYKSGKRGARDWQSDWCSVCTEVALYLSVAVKKRVKRIRSHIEAEDTSSLWWLWSPFETGDQSRAATPAHWKKPVEVVWTSSYDASWTPHRWGDSGICNQKKEVGDGLSSSCLGFTLLPPQRSWRRWLASRRLMDILFQDFII